MSNSWVGKTLGKVQIEAPLARGGVAEVYLGTHTTLQRKVAVKILRNPSEEHSDALERFQREARTVAKLRHPNIVQVYDFDMVDNDPYLVMEYIQGPSLSKYLYFLHQNNKRLELPQIVRLISGVANALQYAHNNGIIHRDIKPGNILLISPTSDIEAGEPLPDDFEPVLTDFGLIRFLDSARQTTTGVTAGTPAYMSPEQAQGETTDGRTDVYSLGIVLYELLAGKLPFDGETTMSILLKHVSQAPEPILDIPPSIHKILDRALAKDVKDRFQTPMEFANAFSASVDINPGTMQMEGLASLGPSTIEFQNAPTRIADKKWVKPLGSKWVRLAVAGFTALLVGAFLFFNGLPLSASPEPTSTSPAPTFTFISTGTGTATSTVTPTSVPIILGPSIILHFRDGNAIADQAVLEAERIPAPPADNKYEVWLMSSRKRISLGILTLDEEGMGTLTFTDEQGINLAATYDQAEITIEPENDTRLSSSGWVAYTYTLPEDGLANVRYLLSAYPSAPNKTALIQGLYVNIRKINELALEMQLSYEVSDEKRVRNNAEGILNLIVGSQSPDYKDWDQDGTIFDPSDGFGLSLNGSNPGYFQAVYTETESTIKSANASEPMVTNGERLKISTQNLAQWTQQLQELVLVILDSPSEKNISDLVVLTDQMLNGVDLDKNGNIDPVPGESGAQYAYQYAYSMANMPLFQIGATPTPVPGGGTSSDGGSSGGGSGGAAEPTKKPPPGQVKTDKPKDNNGNNSNKNND